MAKHALLSASGAHRWLECTPSAKLEAQFENKTTTYAEEGTAAHSLAELVTEYWLGTLDRKSKEMNELIYENTLADFKKNERYYTEDMLEHAQAYAKFIYARLADIRKTCNDSFVQLETKIDFSKYVPGGFGTADCVIVADDTMEIVDFKYGKGHKVNAEGNPQMRLYALGAIAAYTELFDINNVKMTIFQPRIAGAISTDEISVKDLTDWAETYVKPRALLASKGKGKFSPSAEACRFCRAKEVCRARTEHNLKLFDEAPDIMCITPDEAGAILEKTLDITSWIKDLEKLVTETLIGGDPVKGWKLVEGRSNRVIKDPKKAAEKLKKEGYADIYETSMLGLTKLEKLVGKKRLAEIVGDLIEKPEGKPVLVPESDARKPYQYKEKLSKEFDKGDF